MECLLPTLGSIGRLFSITANAGENLKRGGKSHFKWENFTSQLQVGLHQLYESNYVSKILLLVLCGTFQDRLTKELEVPAGVAIVHEYPSYSRP
jgi:hypothetical protein